MTNNESNVVWLINVDGVIKGHIVGFEETKKAMETIGNNFINQIKKDKPWLISEILIVNDFHLKVKCKNPGYIYTSKYTAHNIKCEKVAELLPEEFEHIPPQDCSIESGWFTWWSGTVKATEAKNVEPVKQLEQAVEPVVEKIVQAVEPIVEKIVQVVEPVVEQVVEQAVETVVEKVEKGVEPIQQDDLIINQSIKVANAHVSKFSQRQSWGQKKKQ
jgi:hypothetical protein